jgi:hypothetical protein
MHVIRNETALVAMAVTRTVGRLDSKPQGRPPRHEQDRQFLAPISRIRALRVHDGG